LFEIVPNGTKVTIVRQSVKVGVKDKKVYIEVHRDENEKETDPLYGLQVVLFRRSSKNVRITIFEGGHGGATEAGIEWLSKQCKIKRPTGQ